VIEGEDAAVRLGVVGCGYVAEHVHLPVLSRLREVDVVALADRHAARLLRVAERFGVRSAYADVDELVADPAVEAVGVLVPPADHAEVAVAALDAGRHVLVEKPVAASAGDADRLVERAATSAGIAMLGFNHRWLRNVRRARELVGKGALGRIEAVRTTLTSRSRFDADAPEWRRRRELGGGSLLEQGIHHFDLWRFLLGSEVDELYAVAHPADAGAAVTARMSDGVLVQSTLSERTAPINAVEILGREGSLRLRLYHFDGFELVPVDRDESSLAVRARGIASTLRGLPRGLAEMRTGGAFGASYAEQWRQFARAARRGTPVPPTFEDGRRALDIALAAAESASTGEPVSLRTSVPAASETA
jgi:myo-inositol 2-dehydrogenase / D-chiro-inositol 1-dehydrogenase